HRRRGKASADSATDAARRRCAFTFKRHMIDIEPEGDAVRPPRRIHAKRSIEGSEHFVFIGRKMAVEENPYRRIERCDVCLSAKQLASGGEAEGDREQEASFSVQPVRHERGNPRKREQTSRANWFGGKEIP